VALDHRARPATGSASVKPHNGDLIAVVLALLALAALHSAVGIPLTLSIKAMLPG
jgi:hypothetical protein